MSLLSIPRSRSASKSPRHTYRGHRRDSFQPLDAQELTELRARMRTDASYSRTALGTLSYSVVILKIFDRRFYRIGLIYVILSGLLWFLSFYRSRRWRHDFADAQAGEEGHRRDASTSPAVRSTPLNISGPQEEEERVYGAPFVTAGWEVVAITLIVGAVEIALIVMLVNL